MYLYSEVFTISDAFYIISFHLTVKQKCISFLNSRSSPFHLNPLSHSD
uniref:Uncharacterized protein n=1 Tax=Arundo donax TaxID=35708 RepID=A0A0A9FN78_ARUDO